MDINKSPGVSRTQRISDEGLDRLDKQLQRGSRISLFVLKQWVKRYGEPARTIIKKHDAYRPELDDS